MNPDPSSSAQASGRRPLWQWAIATVSLLLVVAIVAGSLMFFGGRLGGRHDTPGYGTPSGQVKLAATVDFTCHLPVSGGQFYAFVSFPDGRFSVDTSVRVQNGKGAQYSWDGPVQRWVPVQSQWLTGDGRSYAYASITTGVPGEAGTSALMLRDVGTGKERRLWEGDGNAQMLGVQGSTVYFARNPTGPVFGGPEIWAVEVSGQNPRRIGPNPPPPAVEAGKPPQQSFGSGPGLIGGGGAWSAGFTRSPVFEPGGPPAKPLGPDRIQRLDLRDGTTRTWFTGPEGHSVALLGFDFDGHPLVAVNQLPPAFPQPTSKEAALKQVSWPEPPRVLLLTAPDQVVQIAAGSDTAFRPVAASADSHGIWFTTPGAIWLFSRGAGLRKLAEIGTDLIPVPTPPPGYPGNGPPPGFTPPAPPPGFPVGPYLRVAGSCT